MNVLTQNAAPSTPADLTFLKEVLVLTVNKGYWADPVSHVFPNRMYTRNLLSNRFGRWGSSRNPINNITLALNGLRYIQRHKPKIAFVGSANRIAPWLANWKKRGWLGDTKLVATSQSYLTDEQVGYFDKVIIYCRREISIRKPEVRNKYTFVPLPAAGTYDHLPAEDTQNPHIFSGGGAGRDFTSLIEAMRQLPHIPLKIVTFSPESLGYPIENLPPNVTVEWRMPPQQFVNTMARARFVVVPLKAGEFPHGHTTIVQGVRMGKAVISNLQASADDYVADNHNGYLLPPGDIGQYTQKIQQLWESDQLRQSFGHASLAMAVNLTYSAFGQHITHLCHALINSD